MKKKLSIALAAAIAPAAVLPIANTPAPHSPLPAASAQPLGAVIPEATEPLAPGDDEEADAEAEDEPHYPDPRDKAPNTDNCPNATLPPEAVSTSERIAPGAPTPTPLPVDYDGPCGIIAPDKFKVSDKVLATAWLVADPDTGDVIAMKDPHGRYRPASIIKVLLALVVIDELKLDQVVTVSEESAGQEGSAVGIGPNGKYSIDDLLHGLLMVSGNDAAHALAQVLGGDEVTLRKVNEKAAELGMKDTRAASYSGLDAPGMSTSAWDMGIAYSAAFKNPTFNKIVSTEMYPFPGYKDANGEDIPGFDVYNDNQLYLNDPDGIGGKTGYTDDAKHTFVGALDRDGRRLMAIVLDTTIDKGRAWEQTQDLIHEAYKFSSDDAVASLIDATAEPSNTGTPVTDAPDAGADSPGNAEDGALPWEGIAVFVGVVALAGIGTWLSLASAKKRRQRQ
ncbi:D-alanyl-D-alanine carboxypeptidase family protein [uncultured Corynebacterium sp.]|uniref:D-alanyl-D-alanine carboxypeptidase family protein n=1 Tax=uncultured Corynebacterium sp. TaxID=159447 RepID=UPI002604D9A4|nr:serine hydrolase [uncultured Corynebacterium sp.]